MLYIAQAQTRLSRWAARTSVYRRRTLDTHLPRSRAKVFAELLPSGDEATEFQRFVAFLQERVQLVRVHPGQVIVRQGDVADYFYMVRSGFVKIN